MLDNSKYRKIDADENETMKIPTRPTQSTVKQPARTQPTRTQVQPTRTQPQPARTQPQASAPSRTYTSGGNSNIMEANADQKRQQIQRASAVRGHAGRGTSRSKRQLIIYGVIIAFEVIVEIALVLFILFGGVSGKSSSGSNTASSQQSNTVNVDNDNFSLTCTKVSITNDVDGNSAMLVYFTFTNKTANPLSMSNVFVPSASQNMTNLATDVTLAEETTEMFNKDTQVSNGESIECAYAFELLDTVSPLTLTMRDNYETFSDIGSTVVDIKGE